MAYTVSLSSLLEESGSKEGITRVAFPNGKGEGPRWTEIQEVMVSRETYQESPETGHVKFFYVLQGDGSLSSGEIHALLRKGSTLFLKEGESFRVTRTSITPFIFLRCIIEK